MRSFEYIQTIISCRETLFSSVSKSKNLQQILRISPADARHVEVRALLASSKLSRHHEALQTSLAATTYLGRLVQSSEEIGLKIKAAAQYEGASVLWDQGEMTASIRMLQDLVHGTDLEKQAIQIGKPELLAKLVC